ncbi:hypothetical protein Raf01_40620 [Rugosimonospora africana]|uniref:Uncharacterized protein n=1 Tax=Rugosimonospora africana TaxID=556532 RepID=A0A8J3QU84_9ACTN|nr:hypothetical protein Raf01_40620 [Rugosimonospora africana]
MAGCTASAISHPVVSTIEHSAAEIRTHRAIGRSGGIGPSTAFPTSRTSCLWGIVPAGPVPGPRLRGTGPRSAPSTMDGTGRSAAPVAVARSCQEVAVVITVSRTSYVGCPIRVYLPDGLVLRLPFTTVAPS